MDTRGAAPPPFRFGRWTAGRGGSRWPVSLRRAVASRCGRGRASRCAPGELSLGAAQTMGREGPYRCAQTFPERCGRRRRFLGPGPPGPGRPPPAASSGLPPRDPVASGRGAAGGKAWWGGRCSDTCGRARETKRGCVRPEVRKPGAGGGRARTSPSPGLLFAERTSTRAEQEINTSCPLISPSPAEQAAGSFRRGGLLMR